MKNPSGPIVSAVEAGWTHENRLKQAALNPISSVCMTLQVMWPSGCTIAGMKITKRHQAQLKSGKVVTVPIVSSVVDPTVVHHNHCALPSVINSNPIQHMMLLASA